MKATNFNFSFRSEKVKKAFKLYAVQQGKSLQDIITEALKEKYPTLIK